jgi:3-deoxy-D-manno-octulosonate 8-phosphate phosphatase (KDO 8-P phosphatase)
MDVDGVMTDGSLVYTSAGHEGKSFDVKDGYGIVKAGREGIMCGIITGKTSSIVEKRARDLGMREVHQGVRDKESVYLRILKKMKLSESEVAYIGDDEPDLPVLGRVGFSAAPRDAVVSVRKAAQYTCMAMGGHGAVREVIDLILDAQKGKRKK